MGTKVLFIHHGGSVGGAPISMLQMAAGLDRSRFDPLFVFTSGGPILELAQRYGISAKVVPMRSVFSYGAHVPVSLRMLVGYSVHYRRTVKTAEELVRELEPEIVHLNTSVLLPTAVGVKRTGKAKLVWHVREVPGASPVLRRWMVSRIWEKADHIVVNSEYVGRSYSGAKPVTVVHNALDSGSFFPRGAPERRMARAELGLPADASVVGIIGSVQETKGHFVLVRAARRIAQESPGVRFLVVAGGVPESYSSTFKGRIKRLFGLPADNLERMKRVVGRDGLAGSFIFCGFQSDVPKVISAMDVLVFPSLAPEGFGRPIIEGMAMGCPVVASDIGPSREIAADAAVLVPPGSASGLAEGVLSVLRNSERARELARLGRQRFLNCFEMKAAVAKLETVYEQVLGRRGATALA